jgi:hypothetical protein
MSNATRGSRLAAHAGQFEVCYRSPQSATFFARTLEMSSGYADEG